MDQVLINWFETWEMGMVYNSVYDKIYEILPN